MVSAGISRIFSSFPVPPLCYDMLTQGKQNAISNGKISNSTPSVCALCKCLHSWKHWKLKWQEFGWTNTALKRLFNLERLRSDNTDAQNKLTLISKKKHFQSPEGWKMKCGKPLCHKEGRRGRILFVSTEHSFNSPLEFTFKKKEKKKKQKQSFNDSGDYFWTFNSVLWIKDWKD